MATHSSILAWGIQGTEEPGGGAGYSPWGHKRVRHDRACMHPTPTPNKCSPISWSSNSS